MRRRTIGIGLAGLGVAGAALTIGCGEVSVTGCATNETCEPLDASLDAATLDAAPDVTVGASDAGPDVDGASVVDAAVACDPDASPHDAPCVVALANGVFVAPQVLGGSDTTGNGSSGQPYATIGFALAHTNGAKRVYVCGGSFNEAVEIDAGVSLYGGLNCAGSPPIWGAGDGGLSQVTAPSNGIALIVDGVSNGISIEDMAFEALDASGQDDAGNGRSSIAAAMRASTVTFRRCTFTAGAGDDGLNGANGASAPNYATAIAPNGDANDGGMGGAGGSVNCADGTRSLGGAGGSAEGSLSGDDGGAVPLPTLNLSAGFDGIGGVDAPVKCGNGDPGASGAAGDAGVRATSYGALRGWNWSPSQGIPGDNGRPGQGGGGGGGRSGAVLGGTGGGSGGCGGAGGAGGAGGGASIAVVCTVSTVSLGSCALRTARAGRGGNGGDGQPGQGGGATAISNVCLGGYGGNGAGGGGGTGGTGGTSVCAVLSGSTLTGSPLCALGDAGAAGIGGDGGAGGDNATPQGNAAPPGAAGSAGLAGAAQPQLSLQ